MNPDEIRQVHINGALRDGELDEMQACIDAAEPGEWRVKEASAGAVIVRYGGQPVSTIDSFRLMARSRAYVPRLLRGVRVLEEALRSAWASIAAFKRECAAERAGREADALRAAEGKTGPDGEVATLARLCALGTFPEYRIPYLERLLRTWAGGGSVDGDGRLSSELEAAVRHRREQDEIARAVEAETRELQAKLRDWLRRLDAGEVPEEMRAAWGKQRIKPRAGSTRSTAGG